MQAISSRHSLAGLATLIFISSTALTAQQVTGGIFRPRAPIHLMHLSAMRPSSAKDVDRGTTFKVITNQDGAYTLPRVPVGTYEVRAEVSGFQTAVTRLELQLNQNARVDFQMRIGQVTETVDVNAAAPLLQTETTELGTVINSRDERYSAAGHSQLCPIDPARAGIG